MQTTPTTGPPFRAPPAIDVVAPPVRQEAMPSPKPAQAVQPAPALRPSLQTNTQQVAQPGSNLILTAVSVLLIVAALAALAAFAYISQ